MAAPSSSSSSVASASTARPLTRWDHLIASACKAADDAPDENEFDHRFHDHITQATHDLTGDDELDLLAIDADLFWYLRAFTRTGDFHELYAYLNQHATEDVHLEVRDLDADEQPELVHKLRRVHACHAAAWAALLAWVTVGAHVAGADADIGAISDTDRVGKRAHRMHALMRIAAS